MINFKVLFRFIKKIFTNWILYLGFLPKVYDYIGAYFQWEYALPTGIIKLFIVLAIAYAIYKAYEEEYIDREKLEEKLSGPTRYNVMASLIPVDFQEETLISHLDGIKIEAEEKLQSLPDPIAITEYDKHVYAFQHAISSLTKKDKSPQSYNKELQQYKSKLKSIIDNIDKNKETLISRIKSFEKRFFFVDFVLTNTGVISDSDINIIIECQNENKVLEKEEALRDKMNLFRLFPIIPTEPKKPKLIGYDTYSTQHLEINRPFDFERFNIEPINAYRKQLEINDHKCSVTIRDLHVGDEINIFDKELILMKNDDKLNFTITIKSKESTKVLTSDVIVKNLEVKKPLYPSRKEEE